MQAALDAHGLPDDVDFIHVARAFHGGYWVMVQAMPGPCQTGRGNTVQEAYDDAIAQRDLAAKQLADSNAREAARAVLVKAGLSTELLAKG